MRRLLVLGAWFLSTACSATSFGEFPVQLTVPEPDPSDVDAILFLIGDAGGTQAGRSPTLAQLKSDVERWSAALARDSAVSVAYLGDIVYPDGVRDRDHPDFSQDSVRLWNQVDVVAGPRSIEHETLGLFLTGNHDWGNMTGDLAVQRALNLRSELEIAGESTGAHVSLLPTVEDPGPVVRDIRDNVRLIFIDSHWWIQERSEEAKADFFARMEAVIEESGDREVVLLAHHPWASAGPHGVVASGTRSIGLLYLLSKSGTYVQDVNSPAHGDFRQRLRDVFAEAGKLPLVYAAGHDHSLQVLTGNQPGDPKHILVSGAGSKLSTLEDTVGLRYGAARPGYMTLVFRRDNSVDLFVTAGSAEHLSCPAGAQRRMACMDAAADSFEIVYSERVLTVAHARGDSVGREATTETGVASEDPGELEAVDPPPPAVDPSSVDIVGDSVVATPGRSYAGGSLRKLMMGSLNRDLWDIPFKVAVLNLDAVGGTLEPDELSGGKQTLGLKFDGADGRKYQFRSILKDASRAIPEVLRSGPVDDALQDQMAAQFPLSAMVVAELLEAAGVLVARPRPVIMPDDPRLGEYRDLFAGRMGWLEERPNEEDGDRPGFAGSRKITGTDELYEELIEEPASYVDDQALLRARLIDLFVGDWDRHYDNWRWASFPDGDRTRWEAIPRDRDWALAKIDGVLPSLARIYYPKYVGFGPEYPSIKRLTWAAQNFDRRLLNERTREDFLRQAQSLQSAFSDEVLRDAVAVLPEPYRERIGDELLASFRARRDRLDEAAEEFYALLSSWVDVRGTEEVDHVRISRGANRSVRVTMTSGEGGFVTFDRTFLANETDEVRIYLLDGDDIVEFDGTADLPIRFQIVGGDGDDLLVAPGQLGSREIDHQGVAIGNANFFDADPFPTPVEGLDEDDAEERELVGDRPTLVWDRRDWGREWIPTPALDYASEFGLHLGMSLTRRRYAFGKSPFDNQFELMVMGASSPSRLVATAGYEKRFLRRDVALRVDAVFKTQRLTRFFGYGNGTANTLAEELYETRRSIRRVDVTLGYRPHGRHWTVKAGSRVQRRGRPDNPDPPVFRIFPVSGSDATTLVGAILGVSRDSRDHENHPFNGSVVDGEIAAYPALLDAETAFTTATLSARKYIGRDEWPGQPALHLAAFGQASTAGAPYFEAASLGGRNTLPGYRTGRFRGRRAASVSALLRGELFSVKTALGRIALGLHATGAMGRVWHPDDVSDEIHTGVGGGLWIRSGALAKTMSLSLVGGERGLRSYLALGFPF